MSIAGRVKLIIKKYFVAGLLVTVPLMVTYFVLRFLFGALDGLLNPLMHKLLGHNIPGLGAIVTILLVFLAGVIATNYLGARLFSLGDRFLGHTPLVRIVYTAAKQLVESMAAPTDKAFSEVVLVEYPRKGVYALGFLSGTCRLQLGAVPEKRRLVFLPTTPTPFAGYVVMVPEEDVYWVDMTLEAAVKLLVSGGIVTPELIRAAQRPGNYEVPDAAGKPVG